MLRIGLNNVGISICIGNFTSKKNKKHPHLRKRKFNQTSLNESNEGGSNVDITLSIEALQCNEKQQQSDSKLLNHDDFNLCSSKRAIPRATYARSKRPSINTPGSSIHSPAPYRTPSYTGVSYNIPSPLSPFSTIQPQASKISTDHTIDTR